MRKGLRTAQQLKNEGSKAQQCWATLVKSQILTGAKVGPAQQLLGEQ